MTVIIIATRMHQDALLPQYSAWSHDGFLLALQSSTLISKFSGDTAVGQGPAGGRQRTTPWDRSPVPGFVRQGVVLSTGERTIKGLLPLSPKQKRLQEALGGVADGVCRKLEKSFSVLHHAEFVGQGR